jgi:hypothetical protein
MSGNLYRKITNEHFFNDKDLSFINSEIFDALLESAGFSKNILYRK